MNGRATLKPPSISSRALFTMGATRSASASTDGTGKASGTQRYELIGRGIRQAPVLRRGPRSKRRRASLAVGLAIVACGACLHSVAALAGEKPAPPTVVAIRAGFDGRFKVGYWTPFEVTILGGANSVRGRVELTVLDGDAVPSRVTAPSGEELAIGAGEKVSVPLYAKIGQLNSSLIVDFRGEGQLLATRRFSTTQHPELAGILPSSQELIVTLGSPLSASDLLAFDQWRAKVVDLAELRRLPADWWGYEGVDAVILATGHDEISSQLSTDSPRVAALEQWVRMGGKLILCVGRQAEKILAPGSPLAKLAPGTFEAMVPLRQSTMLETYAETSEPFAAAGGPFSLEVPKLRDVRGKIEAYAGLHARDLPLVVRAAHGFGEVVFIGFDLERAPLRQWAARPQLFEKLLRRSKSATAPGDSGALGQVTTLGFVDLAGQLRGALDQFEGVYLVPFWLVALLVLAYIACIGPLDYFLVKKVLRRMEATWFTFAITVVVFSAGAVGLAYGLKGREICVNQVDVVDFDAETNLVRGTVWANCFSPKTDTYDLSLRPPAAGRQSTAPEIIFSWMGLPGTGFGGMDPDQKFGGIDPAAGSMPLLTDAYSFSGKLDRMERVPIAVWSSKAFVGRWWQHGESQIEAQLSDRGKLVGTLSSHLDAPLEDSVLLYDRWAYPLRQLQPGQQVDIETGLDPQTVDTYLRHVTVQGDRNVAPPYDRASFDVPRIVEIMTTYELAGGEKYTGLANAYQDFIDLSGLVKNGRAVLIGRKAQRATELERDGRPLGNGDSRHWTIYRYVFPVREHSAP